MRPGAAARHAARLDERVYALIDVMRAIATRSGDDGGARRAGWVPGRPGVVSPIIGARTMEQLDDNLAALEVKLTGDDMARLDEASKPQLAFPADFLDFAPMFTFGGATIDGRKGDVWPMAPQNDAERY